MFLSLLSFVTMSVAGSTFVTQSPRTQAAKIFERLTGTPLLSNDPRLAQMEKLIVEGKPLEAAAIATEDEKFLRITVKAVASVMSSRTESPYEEFNDFQALFLGATRDDLDARTLLTGNFTYRGSSSLSVTPPSESDNSHYAELEQNRINLKAMLVKVTPQRADFPESAGLLTTRAWAAAHYQAGTNRRSLEYAFREFLCTPIQRWRDTGIPEHRIRRDVDRGPGGNPATFKQECLLCHAPMDALSGAFARMDFINGRIVHTGPDQVARKVNQNGSVYPEGHVTVDDSWINYATQNQNEAFGWRGPLTGNGVNSLGAMIANSKGFQSCMVKRVYKEVCRKELTNQEHDLTETLSNRFSDSGYQLKRLFQEVAITPTCLSAAEKSQLNSEESDENF